MESILPKITFSATWELHKINSKSDWTQTLPDTNVLDDSTPYSCEKHLQDSENLYREFTIGKDLVIIFSIRVSRQKEHSC